MPNNNPDPPWRVLATCYGYRPEEWWIFDKQTEYWVAESGRMDAISIELTPIDHSRNDPEALEIIRKAKEAT